MKNLLFLLLTTGFLLAFGCQKDSLHSSEVNTEDQLQERSRRPSMVLESIELNCNNLGTEVLVELEGMNHVLNYQVTVEDSDGNMLETYIGENPDYDLVVNLTLGYVSQEKDCTYFLEGETFTISAFKIMADQSLSEAMDSPRDVSVPIDYCDC